ncbi:MULTISPECIES: dermonecrotic toxin domain-containing protein [unclassified Pseudomonas]|uniref:dermonecrotic toxin domain-containing protein n=1 Tax=unclassified Pseudomonas TaxID=196821 RepID=UPI0015A30D50|nr:MULTISPECIES: DUF6543 domain-containing protein [unclassified Pseudomonas]NWC95128.1 hypothetical protein [Pseudomonas sp. IPO3779]NWD16381.1 hypothetical protein [Pseudomonas sp. IPO3778]
MTTEPQSPPVDPDDALSGQARLRSLLARRLDASPTPSRFINALQVAEVRCRESTRQLRRQLELAPSIHRLVRKALREAFDLDPDRLLFSETSTPGGPPVVDSLTDRALGLLDNPQFAIHLNRYTALSVQGDAERTLPFSASEVLHKVNGLDLPGKIRSAVSGYWQGLAFASAASREERWVQVYQGVFAERAFIAHALYDLSDHGFSMALGLLDAPTPQARAQAGGAWERLQVSELRWGDVPLGGALHLYRTGDGLARRQVIYLPGLARPFHEFASLAQMQLALPALFLGPERSVLWSRLPLDRRPASPLAFTVHRAPPLTDDALRHSALAYVQTQRDNEWNGLLARHAASVGLDGQANGALSALQRLRLVERGRRLVQGGEGLRVALEQLLEWDRQRRAPEVVCAALHPGLAMRTAEDLVRRHEQGLLALLDKSDSSQDYAPYSAFQSLQAQWLEQAQALQASLEGQEHRLGLRGFWLEKPAGSVASRGVQRLKVQRSALLKDAHLQYRLGLLSEPDLTLLVEVLNTPLAAGRAASGTRVLHVSVGRSGRPLYRLLGVFVVTTLEALNHPDRRQPAVLHVPGTDGGFQAFGSLDELSTSLDASFKSPDGSALWHCVGRDQRREAYTLVGALAASEPLLVYYQVMEGNVLSDSFKEQIDRYARTERWVAEGGRPFSEVTDPALTRTLLARELADSLQVPLSAARAQALANISVLRLGVAQAKTLPAWLPGASRVLRKRYQRLRTHYLTSAAALEQQLLQALPGLEAFARRTLTEHLSREGLTEPLDIDTPFLDMPDDVSTHWQSHPQRPAGDSGVRTVVSEGRHTYSLFQLALHNLDPEAPWTRWRLQYSRYIEPLWARQLPAERLIGLIAKLDLAGQYEGLITRCFYPGSSQVPAALPRALLERPLIQRARLEQFSATQQGLSTVAHSVFSTALEARAPADLKKNGHDLQLCCVHLAALTLEQPRHVAGVLIIHDQPSAKALLYWPAVQGFAPLTEHASVAAARSALLEMAATPANLKVLAQHIAPGWEQPALASYPVPVEASGSRMDGRFEPFKGGWSILPSPFGLVGWAIRGLTRWFRTRRSQPATTLPEIEQELREQWADDPGRWLGVTRTTGCDLVRILAHAQVLGLEREVRAVANSARELASYRELRLGEQSAARVRGLLSFIPGVSVGVNLYEVLLAARRFHHSGDARDGLATGFATLILIADIALTVFPPGKGVVRPHLPVRPVSIVPILNQIRRQPRPPGVAHLGLPVTRRGLKGMEVYRKDLTVDGAVTLHGPVNQGSQVKAGEQFIVEGGGVYPVHRRRTERTLRLKHPDGSPQDELFLSIEQPREWLLGADAPEPRAGTSSGIRRPWEAVTGGTEWVAPTASHAERAGRQPPLAASHWRAWGRQLNEDAVQEISASRRLYRVQGEVAYDAVKLGDHYYELLPNGSTVPDNLIFLRGPEPPLPVGRDELVRWLTPEIREQPIPATFGADRSWALREPLFRRPLSTSVATAFPGLTQASNRFVTERLLELGDAGRSMTATRLLNIRATLDDWLPPAPAAAGQTDDLLRMLRPVPRGGRISINISHDGQAPGLQRVDFQLPVPLDPSLLNNTSRSLSHARPMAAQTAVRQVLERQGFRVQPLHKGSSARLVNFVCTHAKSNNLYYVLTRWAESPSVSMGSGGMMQLSDAWLHSNSRSSIMREPHLHSAVLQALKDGRLVRIVAGIQRGRRSSRTTVFFVKMSDA